MQNKSSTKKINSNKIILKLSKMTILKNIKVILNIFLKTQDT